MVIILEVVGSNPTGAKDFFSFPCVPIFFLTLGQEVLFEIFVQYFNIPSLKHYI